MALPPMPWKVEVTKHGFDYLIDADGKKIATLYGKAEQRDAVGAFLYEVTATKPKEV